MTIEEIKNLKKKDVKQVFSGANDGYYGEYEGKYSYDSQSIGRILNKIKANAEDVVENDPWTKHATDYDSDHRLSIIVGKRVYVVYLKDENNKYQWED